MHIFQLKTGDQFFGQLPTMARAAFDATYRAHNPDDLIDDYMDKAFDPAVMAAEIAKDTNVFLASEQDGSLTGYLQLRPCDEIPESVPDGAIRIERIYAASGHTGRGIGAKLLAAAVRWGVDNGVPALWLGVWNQNHAAIRFYEREGFRQCGEITFMLGDDPQTDNVMVKNIP